MTCKDYIMNNRECCGMTPDIRSEVELNNIQNRLVNDKRFRQNVKFEIAKALSVVDSRVTSCFTDIYIAEVTDYLLKLLMNDSVLPTVYHVIPVFNFEVEEEEETFEEDVVFWLTTPEGRELQYVAAKNEDQKEGYYVLEGDYVLHAGLNGFKEAAVEFSVSGDEEEIKVEVLLEREVESI